MNTFTTLDYAVLILYFGAMAALGPLFASKARTTEGYFLGDRSFPGWLIGFSMFATSISSMTFMAYPGDAYKTAWYRMVPNLTLPLAVLFATMFFLPFFRRAGTVSAYEYLEGRFGKWTRLYAASAFIVSQIIRVSLILFLVSILIEKITGIDVYLCILLGGVITSFYTILGGIRAVLWTDFIQACVLWVGGVISLIAIINVLPGGLGQIFSMASEAGKFAMADLNAEGVMEPIQFSPDFTKKTVTLFLLVGLGNWLTEYSSNQNIIQRYAASKSAKDAKIAMWTCCLFSVPTWALFMFLGTALWVFFQVNPTPEAQAILTGEGGAKAEDILPYFVINFLPKGFSGLVIAGVLAAAMSSLS
ncbi:MAG: sodium/solute symporter, partial [Candidatus Hydrogenedentes bacterium]|nr:sodium/solute symporter [Candidatus Hydrogenedentota bacterium]